MKNFNEVLDILEITTPNTLKNHIKENKVETIIVNGVHHFKNEEVDRLIRNKRNNVALNIRIPEGYITAKEAMNALNKPRHYFTKNMNDIETLKIEKYIFYSEKDVLQKLKNVEELKLLENNNEWVEISTLNVKIKNKIHVLWEQNKIAIDKMRILYDDGKSINFIHKEELDRLLRFGIPEGYITRKEAMSILDKPKHYFTKDMNDVTTLKIGGKLFFYEKDILMKLEKINELRFLEDSSEWIKVIKLEVKIQSRIYVLLEQNKIPIDKIRIYHNGAMPIRFIHREIINDILKQKISSKISTEIKNNSLIKSIFVKDIFNLKDFYECIEKVLNLEVVGKGHKNYSLAEVEEITGIQSDELIELIEDGTLSCFVKEKLNKPVKPYIIYQNGVVKLLKLRRYVSAQEISEISGIHQSGIIRDFNEALKSKEGRIIYFLYKTYAPIDIAFEAIRINAIRVISRESDLKKLLDFRLKLIDTEYKETFNLAKKFLYIKMEKIKNSSITRKEATLTRLINAVESFFSNLDKEVFEYDNEEIIKFAFEWDLKVSFEPKVYAFLNYIRENKKEGCKYNKQIGRSVFNQMKKENESNDNKIYTEEQWYEYYMFLWNIDKHILNAFKDDRYSQIWLYCLLHLSITWRSRDVIDKIPNIPLEVIGVYDFQWFYDKNEFTLSMALKVLKSVRFSLDGIIAYKNKMNLHFNVPLSLKITTAVALVINEIHRRKKDQDCIFYRLKKAPPFKKEYSIFFEKNPVLIGFSNIKACRTLITLGFANAIKTHGMAGVAYMMNRYARSHKEKIDRITNTTEIYHQLKNTDGSATELAFHVFERDSFGYLYIRLLELCYTEEQLSILSQDEMTEIVTDMQAEMSPSMIEQICNGLMNPNELRHMKLEEIMSTQIINKSKTEETGFLSEQLKSVLINKYKEIAGDIFGSDDEKAQEFILMKCESVDSIIKGYVSEGNNSRNILSEIKNGDRNCYSQYANCIYDENELKEKCLSYPATLCEGCLCNIPKISMLYDLSNKLDILMDDMLTNNNLEEIELVRDTTLFHNYINVLIEAKAQYEGMDENILNSFIDITNIKQKISLLREKSKLIYIE
ncbi:hypothetical protein [Clostridium beijerinckii]|uniref:hypothetical protein n=1 Tax=Clostridium beijerinckii TaxID=1520 RepID=UPI0022DFA499|nr:hypothetical protein [Clostridium beijerinckii]